MQRTGDEKQIIYNSVERKKGRDGKRNESPLTGLASKETDTAYLVELEEHCLFKSDIEFRQALFPIVSIKGSNR